MGEGYHKIDICCLIIYNIVKLSLRRPHFGDIVYKNCLQFVGYSSAAADRQSAIYRSKKSISALYKIPVSRS
jgi:hypothetical protein